METTFNRILDSFLETNLDVEIDRIILTDLFQEDRPELIEQIELLQRPMERHIAVNDKGVIVAGQYRRYRLYTYDVWGNEEEGYEVNNVFSTGNVENFLCMEIVHNPDTEHEFYSYPVSDQQIADAFGCDVSRIETDGDDECIYITGEDNYPLGEYRLED